MKPPSAIAPRCSRSSNSEVGRLVVQTTASVTGKILTPEDHRRLAEETARQLHGAEREQAARASGQVGTATTEEAHEANRKVKRAARQLFRLCLVDGLLDEGRARQVAQRVAASRRRGALASCRTSSGWCGSISDRHTALVESATPLASRHAGQHPGWSHARVRTGTRGDASPRIPRSSAGCGSKSAAMSTTTACGPAWRRSRHVCDVFGVR